MRVILIRHRLFIITPAPLKQGDALIAGKHTIQIVQYPLPVPVFGKSSLFMLHIPRKVAPRRVLPVIFPDHPFIKIHSRHGGEVHLTRIGWGAGQNRIAAG